MRPQRIIVCAECGESAVHCAKGMCIRCYKRAKGQAYYLRNKEKILAQTRAYYETHKEQHAASMVAWYKAHPGWMNHYQKAHRARRPEYHAARNATWRAANRGRMVEWARAWQKAHPERTREARRLHNQRRRARARGTQNDRVRVDILYARDGGRCGICKQAVARIAVSLDHVVPLSQGGTHTAENLQISHLVCNVRRRHTGPGQPHLL